jgi:exonuclease SbcC
MLLKRIILRNIRSHENTEINFPQGTILLAGDIGSGKTSILLAIEFALFGLQPGQKGASLLRNNASDGSVRLILEIDNNEITIERDIKRSKSISQENCIITINGQRREMAVSELKSTVLSLLNYPSEFAKKQNLLYKFTVYTPQESMKQIIMEDPQVRLNTLRHIFGIEKYKRIFENLSIVLAKLREEKRRKEGAVQDLEVKMQALLQKEQYLEDKQKNLASLEHELFIKQEERRRFQEDFEAISKKLEEKRNYEKEFEKLNLAVKHKQELLNAHAKLIDRLSREISEIGNVSFRQEDLQELEALMQVIKQEKDQIDNKYIALASSLHSSLAKAEEAKKMQMQINGLVECPTCLQSVNEDYKMQMLQKFSHAFESVQQDIRKFEAEKEQIIEERNKARNKIKEYEDKITENKIAKIKFSQIEEKKNQMHDVQEQHSRAETESQLLAEQIKKTRFSIDKFNEIEGLFLQEQQKLEKASKEERTIELRSIELRKEIEILSIQLEELHKEIELKKAMQKELLHIQSLEYWLSTDFMQLVNFVEKNVLAKLRVEFSSILNAWFSLLVSDALNARLDEDFTPIIEQQDYEIDYAHLSGGERTAVALAYRLALHQVINSVLSSLKTHSLLILDEPTDGFSEQQLDKMRDILQQIQAQQLILVSHEPKIESFVDYIIRLKKENTSSYIC